MNDTLDLPVPMEFVEMVRYWSKITKILEMTIARNVSSILLCVRYTFFAFIMTVKFTFNVINGKKARLTPIDNSLPSSPFPLSGWFRSCNNFYEKEMTCSRVISDT